MPLPELSPDEMLPHHVPPRRPRRIVALSAATLALVAFGAASFVVVQRRAAAKPTAVAESAAPVQSIDEPGWRFTVHLPTGSEALFDLGADPRCRTNVLRDHPERGLRMRRALLERCGVGSMEELRAPHRDLTEALRRLGYL